MKIIKIAGLLVAVLIAALLVAPFLIPKNVTLGWVTAAIENRTPLKVQLGDARFAFLPNPAIHLKEVTVEIEVPEKKEPLPLFRAAALDVASNWVRIWARSPTLAVTLADADVTLTAVGPERYNYSPLLDTPKSAETASSGLIRSAWAQETAASSPTAPGISIERIKIENSRLHYQAWREKSVTYPVDKLIIDDVRHDEKSIRFDTVLQGRFDTLQVDTDFETKIAGDDPNAWQQIEVRSDKTTLLMPGTLAVKKQALELTSQMRQSNKKTEFKEGRAKLGGQSVTFSGVRLDSGAIDITANADPIQFDYLQKIMPGLTGLPAIQQAAATLHYKSSGKSQAKPSISGRLKAQQIRLPEYSFADVSGKFDYRDPVLHINDFKGKTLDGTFQGSAQVDLSGDKPRYSFNLNLQNIAIEQISSVGNLVTGRGSLTLKANGRGFEQADWSRNLDGNGDLNLKQLKLVRLQPFAAFFKSPAWQVVEKVPGAVNANALKSARGIDSRVQDLASQFKIQNGVVKIPTIKLNFPEASAQFKGGIGLDKSLDFNGTLAMDEKLVRSLIKEERLRTALMAGQQHFSIPTKITGTVSDPVIRPDEAVMQQRIQSYLTKSVEKKATESVKQALKPKKTDESEKPADKKSTPGLKDIEGLFKK